MRKRPAAEEGVKPETDKFTYLLELTAAQLRCLGLVELAYGYYYGGLVKVAGYITGVGRDSDYLEFKVTGTQTERLVEALSEPSNRTRCTACFGVLGGRRQKTAAAHPL